MATLSKKIDFALIIRVERANPNGDPLNGNRPRIDYDGFGEISDVCLKRKIRDRLMERYVSLPASEKKGQAVFVQSDDRKIDGMPFLRARAESEEFGLGKAAFSFEKKKKSKKNAQDTAQMPLVSSPPNKKEDTVKKACEKWFDVRTFGQLFAFGKSKETSEKSDEETEGDGSVSIGIRGPVSIQSAFTRERISLSSTQITKSVNAEDENGGRGSDTMGMKHRVDNGIYVTFGSMNPQLAEHTFFTDEDAAVIKEILPKLFENDASSARPEGSMAVETVIWWEHNCKSGQYSSAKVHKSLSVNNDGKYTLAPLAELNPEEIPGF